MTARDYSTSTTDGAAAHASQFSGGYDEVPETLGPEDFCAAGHFDCPSTCRYFTPTPRQTYAEMADGLRAAMARKYVKDETAARWGAA